MFRARFSRSTEGGWGDRYYEDVVSDLATTTITLCQRFFSLCCYFVPHPCEPDSRIRSSSPLMKGSSDLLGEHRLSANRKLDPWEPEEPQNALAMPPPSPPDQSLRSCLFNTSFRPCLSLFGDRGKTYCLVSELERESVGFDSPAIRLLLQTGKSARKFASFSTSRPLSAGTMTTVTHSSSPLLGATRKNLLPGLPRAA